MWGRGRGLPIIGRRCARGSTCQRRLRVSRQLSVESRHRDHAPLLGRAAGGHDTAVDRCDDPTVGTGRRAGPKGDTATGMEAAAGEIAGRTGAPPGRSAVVVVVEEVVVDVEDVVVDDEPGGRGAGGTLRCPAPGPVVSAARGACGVTDTIRPTPRATRPRRGDGDERTRRRDPPVPHPTGRGLRIAGEERLVGEHEDRPLGVLDPAHRGRGIPGRTMPQGPVPVSAGGVGAARRWSRGLRTGAPFAQIAEDVECPVIALDRATAAHRPTRHRARATSWRTTHEHDIEGDHSTSEVTSRHPLNRCCRPGGSRPGRRPTSGLQSDPHHRRGGPARLRSRRGEEGSENEGKSRRDRWTSPAVAMGVVDSPFRLCRRS